MAKFLCFSPWCMFSISMIDYLSTETELKEQDFGFRNGRFVGKLKFLKNADTGPVVLIETESGLMVRLGELNFKIFGDLVYIVSFEYILMWDHPHANLVDSQEWGLKGITIETKVFSWVDSETIIIFTPPRCQFY